MKTLLTLTAVIAFTAQAFCQQVSQEYTEVTKKEFTACAKPQFFPVNQKIKKQGDKLVINLNNGTQKVYNDKKQGDDVEEYYYSGDISFGKIAIFKKSTYHSDEFYLINLATGHIDTVAGLPVFSGSKTDFICMSHPESDNEEQLIQVCEIKNGEVKIRATLKNRPGTNIEAVACIKKNSVVVKDNEERYWKITFSAE
ncbi:hypothetical protein [Foetidibacter luteolus]|uniref:hypothetical protein n=1 Tax=Foetidibacter luteolus TaxID=2608880 RepID=UPI00129A9C61|nr:hypothetical protein [Foetidibacter luteolus]